MAANTDKDNAKGNAQGNPSDETAKVSPDADTAGADSGAGDASPAKAVVVKTTAEKQVSVRTLKEIDCHIGGVDYKFEKDKVVKVPTGVAAILQNAKLIVVNL